MSTRGRSSKRMGWIGGLTFVLFLLAHDVLMATVAHAAPMPLAMSHSRPSHHAEAAAPVMPEPDPAPEHPKDCSATGDAIPAAGLDLEPFGLLSVVPATELQMATLTVLNRWSEPLWPPGVRRAWLQVYRI